MKKLLSLSLVSLSVLFAAAAEKDPFTRRDPVPMAGRWDLKVRDGEREYPSWLEVQLSGYRTLVGSYVGQSGSVRPIGEIKFDDPTGAFTFELPPQWERRTNTMVFQGKLQGDLLMGETTNDQGENIRWEGRRAPSLARAQPPRWGKTIKLFNGHDLAGWKPRKPQVPNGWRVQNGHLTNAVPGNDILTVQQFTDFKLRAEFRYPKASNSGIYLRGRYEVQIEDDFGKDPDAHGMGGVYGFLAPRVNACKNADEWQTMEISLVGRVVTVVLNGETIIDRQPIPGITGAALDSDEGKPGPILIQGDHGRVEFKELMLTPAE